MSDSSTVLLTADGVGLTYKSRVWGFRHFEFEAFRDVSFELRRGETLGVLGRNGCGKSSLLRVLSGIIRPTKGTIKHEPRISRALLSLGLGFRTDLSGRDNAYLSAMLQGCSRNRAKQVLEDIKEFSELEGFFEQPVKTYSSGMRSRLGFATAMKTDVDLLLIDETLSVGDSHFKHKAEKAMMEKINSEQTVVFVSHSAGQIKKVCSRAIWLEEGTIKAEGDVKDVAEQYKTFMNELDVKKGGV